jgi:transposase
MPRKKRRGRGAQTKLTPAVQNRICSALLDGNYKITAAKFGGISYATFAGWMIRGEEEGEGIYFDFFTAVTQALIQAEVSLIHEVRAQVKDDWRAGIELLGRRYPRWTKKEKREVSGPGGGPQQIQNVDMSHYTDEELKAIHEINKAASKRTQAD